MAFIHTDTDAICCLHTGLSTGPPDPLRGTVCTEFPRSLNFVDLSGLKLADLSNQIRPPDRRCSIKG